MFSGFVPNSLFKSIFYLISLILIGYIIYELKIILGYVIIASILTLLARPVVKLLTYRLKFGSTLASIVAISFILIVISGVISLLIPLVLEQGKNLSLLNVNAFQDKINTLYIEFNGYLNKFNIDLNQSLVDIDSVKKEIKKISNSQKIKSLKEKFSRIELFNLKQTGDWISSFNSKSSISEEDLDSLLLELNSFVGLQSVKVEINKIVNFRT